jgi:hypothetical protein
MTYASGPTTVVNAPIDIVWTLLMEARRMGRFL